MPARTNEFQQLVTLIERALAPHGAKITDSAMIKVGNLETIREADVLIEGEFGPYHLKVAIEARGTGRKMSLPEFESLLGKYRGDGCVQVDKLVVVSKRGFSSGVAEKAKANDVELLTISEAKKKDWAKVGPGKFRFQVPPHLHFLDFVPHLPLADPKFAFVRGHLVCRHGNDIGTPHKLASRFFFNQWLPNNQQSYREYERMTVEKFGGDAAINITLPLPEGMRLEFGANRYEIETLKFRVHLKIHESFTTFKQYERQSSKGETRIMNQIEAVAGKTKFSLTFAPGSLSEAQAPGMSPAHRKFLPDKVILNISDATLGDMSSSDSPKRAKKTKRSKP